VEALEAKKIGMTKDKNHFKGVEGNKDMVAYDRKGKIDTIRFKASAFD